MFDFVVVIEIDGLEEVGDVALVGVINGEFFDIGFGIVLNYREINDKVVGYVVYIDLGFLFG